MNISIPDDEIKIVNEAGKEVPRGEVGEVTIRGPTPFVAILTLQNTMRLRSLRMLEPSEKRDFFALVGVFPLDSSFNG